MMGQIRGESQGPGPHGLRAWEAGTGRALVHVHLHDGAEEAVRAGHPWVYDRGIRKVSRAGEPGDLVALYGRKNRLLGLGLYDPDSPIRVRVLHRGRAVVLDDSWWRRHLEEAVHKRTGWFDQRTTGYRLIHGENDGWPGLVLDRYADVLVLKLYTAAWFPWLDRLRTWIVQGLKPRSLVLRWSRNLQARAEREGLPPDGCVLTGKPVHGPIPFVENGLSFEAEVRLGQKTGFFLDQRENRQRVGVLAAGRHILNLFSYSGGFSVYAAQGGAVSVTDLDISPHALESARRHFRINAPLFPRADCQQHLIRADAFEWLASPPARPYDLVILDPPALARQAADRPAALRAYRWLVQRGLRCLRRGGILVAASCSAQVRPEEFFELVRRTISEAGIRHRELATTRHPPDHPAAFPEAEYLKCIYLELTGALATGRPPRKDRCCMPRK